MVDVQSKEVPISQSRASTPNAIATPSIPSVDSRDVVATADSKEPKRQKKLKSEAWLHFERDVLEDGSVKATCNYCKTVFDGRSTKGTTHLNNHTKICVRRPREDIRQKIVAMSTSTSSGCPTSRIGLYKFDVDVERSMFAKMIMKHDVPFLFF